MCIKGDALSVPVVCHALCLFFAARQGLDRHDSDFGRDADAGFEQFFYLLCSGFKVDTALCLDRQNHDVAVLLVIVCQRDRVFACHAVNIL